MKSYSLQKHNGNWIMRWSAYIMKADKRVRTQPVRILGPHAMKKSDAMILAAEHFARVKRSPTVLAGDPLSKFVTDVFFPHCVANLKKDTLKLYKQQWKRLEPHLGSIRLRDVRTPHVQAALDAIHDDRGETLCHEMYVHIEVTCSAIVALAIRRGDHPGPNPADECTVRNYGHTNKNKNGAYDLNQTKQFLTLFADDRDILATIAINAFLALRAPEAEALLPSDYNPVTGLVRIHTHTKTGNDELLPVIGPLRQIMVAGWSKINMRRAERVIRKRIEGTTLDWKGWYGFRRGLLTNLYNLGVHVEKACHVLRNSEKTCRRHYLRLDKATTKQDAMDLLEKAYERETVVTAQ